MHLTPGECNLSGILTFHIVHVTVIRAVSNFVHTTPETVKFAHWVTPVGLLQDKQRVRLRVAPRNAYVRKVLVHQNAVD